MGGSGDLRRCSKLVDVLLFEPVRIAQESSTVDDLLTLSCLGSFAAELAPAPMEPVPDGALRHPRRRGNVGDGVPGVESPLNLVEVHQSRLLQRLVQQSAFTTGHRRRPEHR